jgi:hypothetical protein
LPTNSHQEDGVAKLNPFVPNSPVNPGMFVGRLREVERLERYLQHARAGEALHFMVTGERGIGKSSLLLYLKWLATGRIQIDDASCRFLVVDVDIDKNTTQLGLVKRIELGIRYSLDKSEPARAFLEKAWTFVRRMEAGGLRLRNGGEVKHDELLPDEFALSLAETAARITNPDPVPLLNAVHDGILILIDEADNSSTSLALGAFLKLLTERLQKHGCSRIAIGLAGLPRLRAVLAESHPSAPRAFQEVTLDRLSSAEVARVIDLCLSKAKDKYGVDVQIDAVAKSLLSGLSEGYPHFIQQFGYSAYEYDSDDRIDANDVTASAFGPGGALEAIGDNYYRDAFYGRIKEESYRQVLRIMADKLDEWITKKEIASRFKGKKSSLDNAIHALRERKIILTKEGSKGVYRLQHKGFALWIKIHGTTPEQLRLEGLRRGEGEGMGVTNQPK